MKKLLSIILSICMLLSITAGLNLTAYADTYNGDCGTSVTWELDTETGELIISGTGNMANYGTSNQPWSSYRGSVAIVTINSGVTSIGSYAFYSCGKLKNVSIPDTVTYIGNNAFLRCTSLTSIDIDPSNTSYTSEDGVLFNKDKTTLVKYLAGKPETSYTIPDCVTSIGSDAFCYCSSLTSIEIPNSVTNICNYAFTNCTGLTNITIPNSVTNIGGYAFLSCSGLISVSIPDSVISIGNCAFQACRALTSIDVDPSNTVYSSENGVLFNKDKSTLILYPASKPETSYTIPDAVTSISNDSFLVCKSLTSVTIPDSVTSIGSFAFSGCEGLTSIIMGNGITTIGSSAFNNCTGLTDVYYTGSEDQWNSISISNSSNDYLINATRHYNYVPLCAECTWDSGTVTTPASCTETGVMTYKCTVCTDGEKTEIIPMTEHTPEVIPAVAATCTETGLTEGSKCAECGEILTAQTTVAAKGHTPEVMPAVPATCTETGLTEGSKCSVCDEILTEQETVAAKGHTPEVMPAVAPTCSSTGLTEGSRCSVCGETIIAQTTVAKLAHTPLVFPAVPATTTSTGLTAGSKCTVCGETIIAQTVVDKLPTPTPEPATTTTTPTTTTDTLVAATTKVSVPKITLKTVKSKKSKQITVTWKKNTKVTGYEIQYSTDKKFKKSVKKATIKKNKTTSTTLKKLNGKKKYYVRIRAYKTVNGKKYYSSWSKAMTVTTKK